MLAAAANLLWEIAAERRAGVVVRALACFPETTPAASFDIGSLRAALSSAWEEATGAALPIEFLRCELASAGDRTTTDAIRNLAIAQTRQQLEADLAVVIETLVRMHVARCHDGSSDSSCCRHVSHLLAPQDR